ncbi:uncharacterized protein EI97DRAFT_125978 [Westerdykella ornata]|uniref:Rhodopsin domain-containing protein n=1 Tax=Westerdykella ornata TaxID=318751 RepID=A0A6A6JGH4_WESOR|nr:uncharacterized protein EI97DRAFT_125978 [Westerdykella ornata]KAF2274319.1 hypothetical protein EI97DRAFT_125978 [Westerdykella ornata]
MSPFKTSLGEALMKRQAPGVPPPPTPEEIAFTNAPEILAITGTFFALASFVFLLRCYVRLGMLKVFGTDDYVMTIAMLLAAAVFACFKIETDHGLGKHFMVLLGTDPAGYMQLSKVLYVHSILIMVAISTVKISIGFFLLRLSTSKPFHRFLFVIMVFIVVLTISCAMTLIFQCVPVQAAWDMSLRPPPLGTGDAKCYSMAVFRNLGLMNSCMMFPPPSSPSRLWMESDVHPAFNIVTDVLFATIPVPLIWRLQLNLRTKFTLIGILSLGLFACVAAIIKAVQQWDVLNDPDWTVKDSFNIWNYIELTVGIIAASLPSLKPLFVSILDTARAITSGGRTKATGYGHSGYGKGAGSLGYIKQPDASNRSIAMQSLTSKEDSGPQSPYKVRITTQPTGLADKEAWDMVHRKASDESMYPLQAEQQDPRGIVMTKEVRVSR